MSVNAFLSELKQFFINSFSDPVYQDGVLYFIIEELPNPRDSGIFKILCGSTQIALDAVGVDDDLAAVVLAEDLLEADHGGDPRVNHVTEEVAGADRWKLVHIADEDDEAEGGMALKRWNARGTSSMEVSSTTTRSTSRGSPGPWVNPWSCGSYLRRR